MQTYTRAISIHRHIHYAHIDTNTYATRRSSFLCSQVFSNSRVLLGADALCVQASSTSLRMLPGTQATFTAVSKDEDQTTSRIPNNRGNRLLLSDPSARAQSCVDIFYEYAVAPVASVDYPQQVDLSSLNPLAAAYLAPFLTPYPITHSPTHSLSHLLTHSNNPNPIPTVSHTLLT